MNLPFVAKAKIGDNMNKIVMALLTTMLLSGAAMAEPVRGYGDSQPKKKISAKQAEKYCNMSAQTKYAHYAKYCKQLQSKKVAPKIEEPVMASSSSDESSGEYFRKASEARSSKFFAGWQELPAAPIESTKRKESAPKKMAIIDLNTNVPGGPLTLSQPSPHPDKARRGRTPTPTFAPEPVRIAREWEGYSIFKNRGDLIKLLSEGNEKRIDPSRIPWCAAFANAILSQAGYEGTGSLLARSFLGYGIPTTYPAEGDIAVFSRGRNQVAGHVGFYVGEETVEGVKYIKVLGGNQRKGVSVAYYPAGRLLGYRKIG